MEFTAPADVTLTDAVLNLSGSYMPVGGEVFMILEKVSTGPITGTFDNLPQGASVPFNGANFIISYQGGTDNNDVTLTFDAPLPVELLDFNARALDNEVKLDWATTTEINNNFFTIERSNDGRSFQKIASISGNGNSSNFNKYSYLDTAPLNGMNYYRLKQTDFDGKFSYSDIRTIEFNDGKQLSIYPTMVEQSLTIESNAGFDTESEIIVRDMRGRRLSSFIFPEKAIRKELILNDLIPGNYYITISNKETVITHKFIKL